MITTRFLACSLAATLISQPALSQQAGAGSSRAETLEDRVASTYIVQLASDLPAGEVRQRARGVAARFNGNVVHVYENTVKGFAIQMSPTAFQRMRGDRTLEIVSVSRDRLVTLPPIEQGPSSQAKPPWAGGGGDDGTTDPTSCTQELPWGIARVTNTLNAAPSSCNDQETTMSLETGLDESRNATIRVCVLDTGVDQDHPDLNVNTVLSMSVFTSGRDKKNDDGNGHGSHVAGTIGAKFTDNAGVIGVVPNVELVSIKVLNSRGSGSLAGVIEGVDATPGKNCDVANMSLGASESVTSLSMLDNAVIAAANHQTNPVIFTIAAGNSSQDTDYYTPARSSRKAETSLSSDDNVFTIASFNKADGWSGFSNFQGAFSYGAYVDFALPGEGILSTYKDGGYATLSGTSMAAPHMAGLIASYLAGNTDAIPHEAGLIARTDTETYSVPMTTSKSTATGGGT